MDDRELNRLLREWKAPDAPPHLRPRRAHASWLRWLVTGTIRVPVPVALAALLLVALWIAVDAAGTDVDARNIRRHGDPASWRDTR